MTAVSFTSLDLKTLPFQSLITSHGDVRPGDVAKGVTEHMYQFSKREVGEEDEIRDQVQFGQEGEAAQQAGIRLEGEQSVEPGTPPRRKSQR